MEDTHSHTLIILPGNQIQKIYYLKLVQEINNNNVTYNWCSVLKDKLFKIQ